MRIHTHPNEGFMQLLAASIDKDPASLEHWNFMHVKSAQDASFEAIEDILIHMKIAHKEVDCDAVHCADNDVLIISRNLPDDAFRAMVTRLQEDAQGNVIQYDLFRDWRSVREVLLAKTGKVQNLNSHLATQDFAEIVLLQEVFEEAKKQRKARMPLHVMVVEDDPLTRRLVTGALKENYALITAQNAQEAITQYLLHAPDIVFLDIGLPDASGFDVLHHIMQCDPDAYVVMFSGNSYLDNVTTALSNGASGFIAKPFKKDKMRHYIHDSALHHRKSF